MGVESHEMDLVKQIVKGDKELFTTLYEQHQRGVYLIAYRMCQSPADAEEVVSEVFYKAYRALPGFKGNSSLASWLYRIAVNESNNLLKRSRRQVPWDPEVPWPNPPPGDDSSFSFDEQLEQLEEIRKLREAMHSLSATDRLILTLRYDQDLSYEEIAIIVQMPKNSVGTRIARAKKALMIKMKEVGFDDQ